MNTPGPYTADILPANGNPHWLCANLTAPDGRLVARVELMRHAGDDRTAENLSMFQAAPEVLGALRDCEERLTYLLRTAEDKTLPNRARAIVCGVRDDLRATLARAEGFTP